MLYGLMAFHTSRVLRLNVEFMSLDGIQGLTLGFVAFSAFFWGYRDFLGSHLMAIGARDILLGYVFIMVKRRYGVT